MTPKEHLIGRLKMLCKANGVEAVAANRGYPPP